MDSQDFEPLNLWPFTEDGLKARKFIKSVIDSLSSLEPNGFISSLYSPIEQTSFIKSLSSTMSSESDIHENGIDIKIAEAIHFIIKEKDLKDSAVQETLTKQLFTAIFSPQSDLCKLLKRRDSIKELHRTAKADPRFFKFVSELIANKNDPEKLDLLKNVQKTYKYSTREACNRAKHGDVYALKQAHSFGINLNDTAQWFGAGSMETHLGPMTPLAVAAGNGHPNCVSFLLETVKVNANSYVGRARDYTALDCVSRWGKDANTSNTIVALLKNHGGFSARIYPVCVAAYSGNLTLFRKKIQEAKKKNISLNLPGKLYSSFTWTNDPFHYKHLEIMTPLAIAVSNGHVDLVKELLQDTTVDVNAKSGKMHNYSPYDCALLFCPEEKRNEIIMLLENRNGQKYDQTNGNPLSITEVKNRG